MHPDTDARFRLKEQDILAHAARMFDFAPESPKKLGGFESFVYELRHPEKPRILRITDSGHRTPTQIHSELDWVNYLAAHEAPVCRPSRSVDGELVKVYRVNNDENNDEYGEYYSLVVFDKAPGKIVANDEWSPALFQTWGETIGKLHRLTVKYRPSDGIAPRRQWYDDDDLVMYKQLNRDHDIVKQRWEELFEHLHTLSKNKAGYDLTHNDIHPGNFFVENGRMTVFDFDDCHYDWLMNDLAVALFYAVRKVGIGDGNVEFAKMFWENLLEGYNREHRLDSRWLKHVPAFLKLREFILYVILHIEDPDSDHPWCVSFMTDRKQRIENDVPVIDMSFEL